MTVIKANRAGGENCDLSPGCFGSASYSTLGCFSRPPVAHKLG